MRALTVRQPYTDAIAFGTKRVENRPRKLPEKYEGELVLLHAAKDLHASGITAVDLEQITWSDISQWTGTRSAILAAVRFTGSHRCADVHWCCKPWGQIETKAHPEVWHWEIGEVVRLAEPVEASGALGFWTPKDTVLEAVRAQLGKVV